MEEKENLKTIANFFFELMQLKREPRTGYTRFGIKNPDSVADHALAAAQIAFILGKMEKANAERAALIALFHDNGEARIGDVQKIAACYLDSDDGEKNAFKEQIKGLPGENDMKEIYQEFEEKTQEGIIAKDADKLELITQVKCFSDQGHDKSAVKLWVNYVKRGLSTDSAKKLCEIIENTSMHDWWKNVSGIKAKIEKYELDK